ncbi:MAG TPA: DUF1513 domain-containing protein [Marinobacter sp.]|nr:DUF1513 domain-containing protein [Marinobacter sp.]
MISFNRRTLFKASLAASAVATLSGCSLLRGTTQSGPGQLAGAVGLPDGTFAINAIDLQGRQLWQAPVESRCHSGCTRPSSNELLFVERRPGWSFYVFNIHTGERLHHIKAEGGEHFVGHGIFSPGGDYLYVPASRYEQGEGIVAVYDSQQNYKRVKTLELKGIGPHQLVMHPDGQTLIVALGGILTHPDYDRIKLNLDTMKPALILMDRNSGEILARFAPSHHQLSCRHVDVSPGGNIYAAYQYQGPRYETRPLVARYRGGQYEEIDFGHEVLAELGNYIASVVAHPENDLVALASPIGGTALIFEGSSGRIVSKTRIKDCAGAEALPGGDFLISSGQGELIHLSAHRSPVELARMPLHWDHHLVL